MENIQHIGSMQEVGHAGSDERGLQVSDLAANRLSVELNAILNKNSADVKGCRLCGVVPLIVMSVLSSLSSQLGTKEVLYVSDKYHNNEEMVASRTLLDMTGVKYRQYYSQEANHN